MNRSIPAGQFKQGCLAILDEVARRHEEVTITKRGKPVAKLVPIVSDAEREEEILRQLRGKAKLLVSTEEFLAPSFADAGWALDER
jgi:prevent-host-death family protein